MTLPEHAANDAFVLRNRAVPDMRREEIIAVHADQIDRQARYDREVQVWYAGQLSPKAVLAADYVNAMFREAHRGRDIVSATAVAELFERHAGMVGSGELMMASPLGYTALSALSYAADRVRGVADPRGLIAYVCQPAPEDALLAS